jgi:hypothetical protein
VLTAAGERAAARAKAERTAARDETLAERPARRRAVEGGWHPPVTLL